MQETFTTAAIEHRKRNLLTDLMLRLVREKPLGLIGGSITLILLLTGIFASILMPYPYQEMHLKDAYQAPSSKYIMGTDNIGRDVFSRVIYGARISMIVGLVGATLATSIAITLGIISGYFGGKVDLVLQRLVDTFMCFPGLFLMMSLISVIGRGFIQVIIVMGLLYSFGGSRVIRSAVISTRENTYVQAALSTGCSSFRVLSRHILPNIMAPIIILFTTQIPGLILFEATLSFLGYGIPPPTPSWGGMLGQIGRDNMLIAPWIAIWPGVALGLSVYGISVLGDAIRDLLDPRLKGGLGRYSGMQSRIQKAQRSVPHSS